MQLNSVLKYGKSRRVEILFVTFCAIIVTFLVSRNIFFKTLVFGDNPLVTIKSRPIIIQYVFSSWHPAAYGENAPWPLGYLLLYAFSQISAMFRDFFGVLFNLFMNISLPLSIMAFYVFLKKFCQRSWVRLLGATFYIINPVVLAYFVSGGFMWPLVFLPMSLNYFISFLEDLNLRDVVKSGVFSALVMWTFPTLSTIAYMILAVLFLIYVLFKGLDFTKKALPLLCVFGLIIVVCNAPYIYAMNVYSQSSQFGYRPTSVLADFRYTYQDISVASLLRFAGNRGSPQVPLGYEDMEEIRNEFGYIIPAITFLSIIWIFRERDERLKWRIISLFLLLLLIILFSLSLKFMANSSLSWIINSISLLWTLRNPFKLQIMLIFSLIPIFAYSVENLSHECLQTIKKRRLKTFIIFLSLIFLSISHIYLYNSFAFEGCMGLTTAYSMEKLVPDEVINVIVNDSLLRFGKGEYRGIILPFSHITELHTQFANPLLYPSRLGIHTETTNALTSKLMENSDLNNLLRLLSTKYVYVIPPESQKDSPWGGPFPIIKVQNYSQLMENLREGSTEELLKGSHLFIVEKTLPRLYLSNQIVYYSNIETISLLTSSIFESNPVFLKMNYDGTFETIKEYSFEDGFENLRDIWVVDNGTWRIENEKLVGKTGAFGQNIMLTNRFSDFTAEYRTKWMFGEVFEQGFIFRAGSDPRTQCYIVFLSSYEDGTVRLCMRDGPHNSTLLQSAPFAPQKGKWYTVKITAKDENVQVWIDNELKINTTNNRFSSGYVGFMSWSGDEEWVLYDDLKIEYNLTHVLSSYSWEIPYSNTQNLNVLLSIDAQETNTTIPLQFYVDNEENLAYLFAKEKEFLRLGEFDLEAGNHQLVIQNNDALSSKEVILSSEFTKFFKNINPFEYGILNETICKITNGMIKTLSSYNSFDLNFKFKPGFGKETYHGPNILFAWTNNDYFRLIFHKENYLELSRNNDVLLVKDITLLTDVFNDVRLIKNKETINLYLNGEHIFTFSDQRMNVEGKIGMGTEESTTIFKNITIIPAPYVAGVCSTFSGTAASVIPDFNQENPGKYSLRINQLSDSPYILCFGENYDSQWEAKVDGQVLSTHHRVNMYANGWILNTTAGIHEIEIYYKPNDTYFLLLYFSIASLIALSVLSYLPEKVMKRIVFPKRKRERILQNINPRL